MKVNIKPREPVEVKVTAAEAKAKPAPKVSKDQSIMPAPVSKVEAASTPTPTLESFDDILDSLASKEDVYGYDLTAAMANLVQLLTKEGLDHKLLEEGLMEVNSILLANPALATEIMLPEHLSPICQASYRLVDENVRAGIVRETARKPGKSKAKAMPLGDLDGSVLD